MNLATIPRMLSQEKSLPSAPPSVPPRRDRFCRKCGGQLPGSAPWACPQCGRKFHPANPKSYARRPPVSRLQWWTRCGLATLAVLGIIFGLTGYGLYRGWQQEQPVIAALKQQGVAITRGPQKTDPNLKPIGGDLGWWLQDKLGPAGYVLDRVQKLDLSERATDEMLTQVRGLDWLRSLSLRETKITDAGLAGLADLSRLRWLDLGHCLKISDEGIPHLLNLTDLEYVDLEYTEVTPDGLKALQAALPGAKIQYGLLINAPAR